MSSWTDYKNQQYMPTKICKSCSTSFEITSQDLAFYDRLKVPSPTLCPNCRLQRRLSWRNERHLYKNTCKLCHKPIIALFPEDSPLTIYCHDCWWSDKWDPMQYGQEPDWNRSFFEQWNELFLKVPMLNLTNGRNLINSEYVNYVTDAKNCYLVFAANFLEDCMHSDYIWESKDSVDCSNGTGLELCYECTDCDRVYNCNYLTNSQRCSDCHLGYDLKNCQNCFACVGLRNTNHCFLNKRLDKAAYQNKVKETLANPKAFTQAQKEFEALDLAHPREYARLLRCENCTGNAIKNCKNCQSCFEGYDGEDLKWVDNFPGDTKDSYDISGCAQLQLSIECACVGLPAYNMRYCNMIVNGGRDMTYCAFIDGGREQFGCIGTKKSKHCIFNKQYGPEEYKTLSQKLIDHMKKTGEWGEFFPAELSPFKYKGTVAQDYFPK